MTTLNARCRNLLALLLQSEQPLASAEIASRLSITPRVVRYNLSTIERWLGQKGIQSIKKPGYGIFIDAPAPVRRALMSELEQLTGYPLVLSCTERLHLLILALLKSSQPLVIKQLEQLLDVSRTTVRRDLDRAEEWFEQHNLQLLRRPHFGLKVVGSEHDLREAIVSFLVANADEAHLLALCGGSRTAVRLPEGGDIGLRQALSAFLLALELSYAHRLAASIENMMDLQFTDNSHVALVLHLAVLIWRVRQGKIVEASPELLESLTRRKEFSVARITAEKIERRFAVSLTESEVTWIAKHCLGAEARTTITGTVQRASTEDSTAAEVREVVDGILAKASVYLHPSLRVDQELAHSLAFHLASAIDQLRFDVRMRNPLLEDVKKRYPYIFEAARKSCMVLEERIGKRIPEEEIGYVATHFVAAMERLGRSSDARKRVLVVCNAGIATAWLLVSRIQGEFPQVQIVGVKSALEVQSKKDFDDIEVIVSTIAIESTNVPTVVVSPFLDKEDVAKLRKVLEAEDTFVASLRPTARGEVGETSLSDLLTAQTIRLKVPAGSWQEVVYQAGKLLLDIGAIEPRYIEAMKEVIVKHGAYMVLWPGIALLHAFPEDGVKRLCMSLVTSAEPVCFGHPDNDPVDIAVALGAVDKRRHLKALSELQRLLEDKEATYKIRHAITKPQVLDVIAHIPQE